MRKCINNAVAKVMQTRREFSSLMKSDFVSFYVNFLSRAILMYNIHRDKHDDNDECKYIFL